MNCIIITLNSVGFGNFTIFPQKLAKHHANLHIFLLSENCRELPTNFVKIEDNNGKLSEKNIFYSFLLEKIVF